MFFDWLTLGDFFSNVYLDCSWDHNTVSTIDNLPTPKAYHALARGGVPNSFEDDSTSDPSFFIVVNSWASLSISPTKSDFVGHIQTINLKLGGMARGMKIEGKGIVE